MGAPSEYASASAYEKACGLNLKVRSSGKHEGQLAMKALVAVMRNFVRALWCMGHDVEHAKAFDNHLLFDLRRLRLQSPVPTRSSQEGGSKWSISGSGTGRQPRRTAVVQPLWHQPGVRDASPSIANALQAPSAATHALAWPARWTFRPTSPPRLVYLRPLRMS